MLDELARRDAWVDRCIDPKSRIPRKQLAEFLAFQMHRDLMPAGLVRAQDAALIFLGGKDDYQTRHNSAGEPDPTDER